MIVRAAVWPFSSEPLESIKIQLSLERSQLMLIEVRRHIVLHEFLGIFHHEASTVWHPTHDILMTVLFHILQHLMQLGGERMLYAAPGPDPELPLLDVSPLSVCDAAPSGNAATLTGLLGINRIPGRQIVHVFMICMINHHRSLLLFLTARFLLLLLAGNKVRLGCSLNQ